MRRAGAPEARRERAVTWEGKKPEGFPTAVEAERRREVIMVAGKGVPTGAIAQR